MAKRKKKGEWKRPPPCKPEEHGRHDHKKAVGKAIKVHLNLHNGCYAFTLKGKVIGYGRSFHLTNVKPTVGKAGWEKCRREQVRNVHAYLRGTLKSTRPTKLKSKKGWRQVSYNCKTHGPFFYFKDNNKPLEHAEEARGWRVMKGDHETCEVWVRGWTEGKMTNPYEQEELFPAEAPKAPKKRKGERVTFGKMNMWEEGSSEGDVLFDGVHVGQIVGNYHDFSSAMSRDYRVISYTAEFWDPVHTERDYQFEQDVAGVRVRRIDGGTPGEPGAARKALSDLRKRIRDTLDPKFHRLSRGSYGPPGPKPRNNPPWYWNPYEQLELFDFGEKAPESAPPIPVAPAVVAPTKPGRITSQEKATAIHEAIEQAASRWGLDQVGVQEVRGLLPRHIEPKAPTRFIKTQLADYKAQAAHGHVEAPIRDEVFLPAQVVPVSASLPPHLRDGLSLLAERTLKPSTGIPGFLAFSEALDPESNVAELIELGFAVQDGPSIVATEAGLLEAASIEKPKKKGKRRLTKQEKENSIHVAIERAISHYGIHGLDVDAVRSFLPIELLKTSENLVRKQLEAYKEAASSFPPDIPHPGVDPIVRPEEKWMSTATVLEELVPDPERVAAYQERQESKRDRLEERAEKKAQEAATRFRGADLREEHSGIPMGQPILVGHHSEKRHRKALARADAHMRKGIEAQEQAADLAYRAERLGTGGISSDDPEAVIKLRKKIASLEQDRETTKEVNKTIRATAKSLGIKKKAHESLNKGDMAKLLHALVDKLDPWALAEVIRNGNAFPWMPTLSARGYGPDIKRATERVEELLREHRRAQEDIAPLEFEGFEIRENTDINRLQFLFDGRVGAKTKAALKARGFRWSPREEAWQRQLNESARWAAKSIAEEITGHGGYLENPVPGVFWEFPDPAKSGGVYAAAMSVIDDLRAGRVDLGDADSAAWFLEAEMEEGTLDDIGIEMLRDEIVKLGGLGPILEATAGANNVHLLTPNGWHLMIHRATRVDAPPGSWQMTEFNEEMIPLGHQYYPSVEAAVLSAHDQYRKLEVVELANPYQNPPPWALSLEPVVGPMLINGHVMEF